MIGREDLSADDRLNSMGGRGRNRELAESVVRPWLEAHTPEEICELGELFRVPVALVGNGRDVLAMDHFVEREVFVERPEGFVAPRSPFLMSASPVPAGRAGAAAWVPTTRRSREHEVAAATAAAAPSSPPPGAGSRRSTASPCSTSPRSGRGRRRHTSSPRSAPT